jgi:hypothetical protein
MFSTRQKRYIADAVQKILRSTEHPELPEGEIQFTLHVNGAESWSWAEIRNNGAIPQPGVNAWNEASDLATMRSPCCAAPVYIASHPSHGMTRWYECSACGQPCDPQQISQRQPC